MPCSRSSSQPRRANVRRSSSIDAMPLPIVLLESRVTNQVKTPSGGRPEGLQPRTAASRTAARIHEAGVAARELPQRLVRHAAVAVGTAEAPRPRARIAAFERELQVLVEGAGRRRGA